jgi:hypothetical protein
MNSQFIFQNIASFSSTMNMSFATSILSKHMNWTKFFDYFLIRSML